MDCSHVYDDELALEFLVEIHSSESHSGLRLILELRVINDRPPVLRCIVRDGARVISSGAVPDEEVAQLLTLVQRHRTSQSGYAMRWHIEPEESEQPANVWDLAGSEMVVEIKQVRPAGFDGVFSFPSDEIENALRQVVAAYTTLLPDQRRIRDRMVAVLSRPDLTDTAAGRRLLLELDDLLIASGLEQESSAAE